MKNLKYYLLVVISLIAFKIVSASNIEDVKVDETIRLQNENKITIIDVREADETKEGKVKGALEIPLSLMTENKTEFDKKTSKLSKDKEIYVYCRSGRRSGIVKEELLKQGYKVKNIGGFETLKSKGLPTEMGGIYGKVNNNCTNC